MPAMEKLLACLAEKRVRATFFVLGHVAELHPEVVPAIEAAGHEIACHGYAHRLIYELSPEEFRNDLRCALDILRKQARSQILGYRAPYWSITEKSLWAVDILVEEGIEYDSSVYPTKTHLYGIPSAPRSTYRLRTPTGRTIIEIPPSVLNLPLWHIPFAGGFWLRVLPYWFIYWAMRLYRRKGDPGLVYIHPPEFDPDKPRVPMPLTDRVLHYWFLKAMGVKIPRLLDDFSFVPIRELLKDHICDARLPTWSM